MRNMYCHRVSTHLQLIIIMWNIETKVISVIIGASGKNLLNNGSKCWTAKIIIIIVIIIIIISFMQDIYICIPETNCVPREYSVAAILLLLFMVLISLVSVLNLLYFYISTFRSMYAVPNMAVFCSSLTSCFPGMLLTYFLNDFEIVPVVPIITVITFVFTLLLLLLLSLSLLTASGLTPGGSSCFSCSLPDLNLLVTNFIFCIQVK